MLLSRIGSCKTFSSVVEYCDTSLAHVLPMFSKKTDLELYCRVIGRLSCSSILTESEVIRVGVFGPPKASILMQKQYDRVALH